MNKTTHHIPYVKVWDFLLPEARLISGLLIFRTNLLGQPLHPLKLKMKYSGFQSDWIHLFQSRIAINFPRWSVCKSKRNLYINLPMFVCDCLTGYSSHTTSPILMKLGMDVCQAPRMMRRYAFLCEHPHTNARNSMHLCSECKSTHARVPTQERPCNSAHTGAPTQELPRKSAHARAPTQECPCKSTHAKVPTQKRTSKSAQAKAHKQKRPCKSAHAKMPTQKRIWALANTK